MELFWYYLLVQLMASSLLVPCYSGVLIKVMKGSKYKFVIKLTWLLLVSNIAAIIVVVANSFVYSWDLKNPVEGIITWGCWVEGSGVAIRDVTFNTAHWMFAYEYYLMAKLMPLALENKKLD